MIGASGIMDTQVAEGLDTERGRNKVNSPFSCQSSSAHLPKTDQVSLYMRNFRKRKSPRWEQDSGNTCDLIMVAREGAMSLLLAHRT